MTNWKKHAEIIFIMVFVNEIIPSIEFRNVFPTDLFSFYTKPKEKVDIAESQKKLKKSTEIFNRLFPNGIQNIFQINFDKHLNDSSEHGQLDSYARDLLRRVTNSLQSVTFFIKPKMFDTTGLDTDKTIFGGRLQDFKDSLKLIYPGTKWCGDGDVASTYEDLGDLKAVDSCCRSHDNCPIYVTAGESKYGLNNTGLFTRSHCSCDTAFFQCLKSVNTLESTALGVTYFTLLGPQCFNSTPGIIDCLEYKSGRCEKYEFENDINLSSHWFDNPIYPI